MNILFLGGDKRYVYMMSDLSKNHSVHQIGFESIDNVFEENLSTLNPAIFDIILFPITGLNDNQELKTMQGLLKIPDNFFNNININTKFFTGLKTRKLLDLIPEKQLISFLDYEDVEIVNNSLTVDGVIDNIKNYKMDTVCILGYRQAWKRNIFKIKKYWL